MKPSIDIAIIGGGMMGSTLALLLNKVLPSKSVHIFDKTPFDSKASSPGNLPSFDCRSTAFAPTTVELMKHLDVWDEMKASSAAILGVQVSDRGHCGWTKLTKKDNSNKSLGFVVQNQVIGQALIRAVSNRDGIVVSAGVEVDKAIPVAGAMNLHLNEGSQVRAGLVIVADGAGSKLGSKLGIQQNVKDYQQSAIVANVEFEIPHQGVAFERFTEQGPMALLPLNGCGGRSSALVWTWPKGQSSYVMGMSDSDFLLELQRCFGYRLGNFIKVSTRNFYSLKRSLATEQVRSNLVVMGNAAHFLHPVAGQGFNLAARDGMRLAHVLLEALGDPSCSLGALSTLMKYHQLQSQDQLSTILLSHGFNEVFGSSHLGLMGLRNLGMLAIENCDLLRSVFVRQMSGRSSSKASLI